MSLIDVKEALHTSVEEISGFIKKQMSDYYLKYHVYSLEKSNSESVDECIERLISMDDGMPILIDTNIEVNRPIVFHNNTIIHGLGFSKSIIRASKSFKGDSIINIDSVQNTELSNITIDGGSDYDWITYSMSSLGVNTKGIYIASTTNHVAVCRISNVQIVYLNGNGVYIEPSTYEIIMDKIIIKGLNDSAIYSRATDSQFNNFIIGACNYKTGDKNDYGCNLEGANNHYTNFKIYYSGTGAAIKMWSGTTRNTYTSFDIQDCAGYALDISEGVDMNEFVGINIHRCENGINAYKCGTNTIKGVITTDIGGTSKFQTERWLTAYEIVGKLYLDIITDVESELTDGINIEYISRIPSYLAALNEQLKIHTNGIYPIELFGGKSNDSSFDNSTAFLNAIKYVNYNGGGTIQFSNGTYYFSTPIVCNERLTGIQIKGTSTSWLKNDGVNFQGTTLYYTGEGYFIDFTNKMIMCKMTDFTLRGNHENYGMNFLKCFKTVFEDIVIMGFTRGLHIGCYTYTTLNRVTLISSNNTKCEYGISVGDGDANEGSASEFLTITNSSFDGNYTGNEDTIIHTANAIEIHSGTHVWVDYLDICNWYGGCGLLIDSDGTCLTAMHNYLHSQITRCSIGIKITTSASDMGFLTFDGILLQMTGKKSSEYGILASKTEGINYSGIAFKNIEWRIIGSVAPEYIIHSDNCNIKCFELTQTINKTSKITIGDRYTNPSIQDCRLQNSKRFAFKGDGTSKEFTATITTNSPYTSVPFISTTMLTSSMEGKYKISKITHSNGGNFEITFVFDEALASDITYLMYVNISDTGTQL